MYIFRTKEAKQQIMTQIMTIILLISDMDGGSKVVTGHVLIIRVCKHVKRDTYITP